jgi:outer membrane usher protein
VRRLLPLAVSLAFVTTAASESPASAAEPIIVEIRLNEQPQGPTLIVRRDRDGTLLVRALDLPLLRLRTPSDSSIEIDGETYVRIGPEWDATVAFDEAAQMVHVQLPAWAFLATRGSGRAREVPQVTPAAPGAFFNYDLYAERVDKRSRIGAMLDLGIFGPRGVVTNSLLARNDDEFEGAVRLDSTWTLDLPSRLATLRVGDTISASGSWGRSVRFGGVQFGTNFSTQPTLVTTPLLYAEGEAVVPSTVDVFVNGQRVASEDVPPGPFTIDRLPPITGAGQMQVVVTDALGRQQVVAQPYYTGPTLLRAGLSQHSLEFGAIREDFGRRSGSYGDLVMAGTLRRGITDIFTAELHVEAQGGAARAAGLDTAWQVGSLGILTLTAAAGGDEDYGWLGGVGVERNGRDFSLLVRTQYASRDFAQLGTAGQADRPKQRSFASLGFNLGARGNLRLSYGVQSSWSKSTNQTAALSHTVTLAPHGYLSLIATHSTGATSSTDLFLNWTMSFGERRTASASLQGSPGATDRESLTAVATLQQSLPAGSGTGYYVALSSEEEVQVDYALQGDSGLAGFQYARRNGTDGWRASAGGGLAITHAGVMPARRLDRSFAVIEVADFPDMTIYVENQPVGRTDRKGRVLLDSLRAYESNAISIDPRELPMDAALATNVMTVTPAWRSGPVVRFPVARASAATLRLVTPDGVPVPAGALVLTRHEQVPVALDGLVYLTAAEGRQSARAEWLGQRCEFDFERPEQADPLPDLGEVTCRPVAATDMRPS